MKLRFAKFTDPMYSADKIVEFNAEDVMAIEQRQVSLLMRGKFWATYVTLKNGNEFSLSGKVGDEIEAARRKAQGTTSTN